MTRPIPSPSSGAPGSRSLDALGPLILSAVTVASEGIVRAAFDAVREHPLWARSLASARAAGCEAMDVHVTTTACLARRSAEAHIRASPHLPVSPAATTRPVMSRQSCEGRSFPRLRPNLN